MNKGSTAWYKAMARKIENARLNLMVASGKKSRIVHLLPFNQVFIFHQTGFKSEHFDEIINVLKSNK